MVNNLRASVSQETVALRGQLDSIKQRLESAEETRKMQSSQIQKLLLDKIELQGDSISQRERMLARERDFTALKRNAASGGSDAGAALAEMEEQLRSAHAEVVDLQEKLEKARTFIRQQDALAREKYTALNVRSFSLPDVPDGSDACNPRLKARILRRRQSTRARSDNWKRSWKGLL